MIIETARLILSSIQLDDIDAVFETMNSRSVADIISFLKWPMTRNQALSWCLKSKNGLESKKEFLFLARSKNSQNPIGCISIHLKETPKQGEVGYWVAEQYHGQGFATEMLQAIIPFAFQTLHLDTLSATAALENSASLSVLQKQGFQIIGKKELPTAKDTKLVCHLLELKNL